jgi:hypothetical protein
VKDHKYSTVKLNLTLGALPPVQPINEAPDYEIHHYTEAEPDPSGQTEEQALSPFPQPAAIEEGQANAAPPQTLPTTANTIPTLPGPYHELLIFDISH